jgi:type III pantothenate kinase
VLLTVDIGNTMVNLGVFENERLRSVKRIGTDQVLVEKGIGELSEQIEAVAISSVVPALTPLFERLAVERDIRSLVVDHRLDLGIKLDVEVPSEVGADRICNAVAAYFTYGSPAIVIDFGTAITFDVLDRGGVYRGGSILPGALLGAQVLARMTAMLPSIDLQKPENLIGKNTEEAMQAGIFYGIIGGVTFIYERIREDLDDAELIVTGGGLELFEEDLDIGGVHNPHLTLEGLRMIYERNEG